jgi:hypothetical protein
LFLFLCSLCICFINYHYHFICCTATKMSQQEEYQRLARQLVDAWQEGMATMMNDGDFIRVLMQMMQSQSFSATQAGTYANPFTTQPAGSAAAAHGAGDAALVRLEQRLRAIEERLEGIENAAARVSKSTKARKPLAKSAKRSPSRTSRTGRGRKKSG